MRFDLLTYQVWSLPLTFGLIVSCVVVLAETPPPARGVQSVAKVVRLVEECHRPQPLGLPVRLSLTPVPANVHEHMPGAGPAPLEMQTARE